MLVVKLLGGETYWDAKPGSGPGAGCSGIEKQQILLGKPNTGEAMVWNLEQNIAMTSTGPMERPEPFCVLDMARRRILQQ